MFLMDPTRCLGGVAGINCRRVRSALASVLRLSLGSPTYSARGARLTKDWTNDLSGRLSMARKMADLTWLRVGGPAEFFYQPSDLDDLCNAMRAIPKDVPIFPMGVGSNLIVRDGGISGLVLRLGRSFSDIEIKGTNVTAGAAALDARVANQAAEAGLDLTFLRTIPGSIGGAVRMNAGCYGTYVADHLVSAELVMRDGSVATVKTEDLHLSYRSSDVPKGAVIVSATFQAPEGDPESLLAKMADQLKRRDESQPTKDRTAGSTFRNPAGFSSTGKADDVHDLKAWKVIDDAGLRGYEVGGAQMSNKHPNFLTNTGQATAYELESLGEFVRKRVFETSGLRLEWEIMRVGEPGRDGPVYYGYLWVRRLILREAQD